VTLWWILAFSLIGSIGATLGGGVLLLLPEPTQKRLLPSLLSFAAGSLLGAACLGMLPKALESLEPSPVLASFLAGLVLFFILEKVLLWRHCHDQDCDAHSQAGPLLLVGDAFHNFVDGVVIAAAFLVSRPLGIATALAVVAHEVPQELGDLAVLLNSGYPRRRALLLNLLSASATIPGAIVGLFALDSGRHLVPYVLAISAASFIYIAIADVVPALHRETRPLQGTLQVALLLLGIGVLLALTMVL
jgi:zinc and cadmium transporter